MLDNNMKETDADKAVRGRVFEMTEDELRQFIERFESIEAEKRQNSLDQAEIMAEAKARGYSTAAMRTIIKMRKLRPDDLAEQEAVLDIYRRALGMN